MEPCQCTEAGWCQRHQVNKTEQWVRLCQASEKYRAAWDAGVGPGQIRPSTSPPVKRKKPSGPGTELRALLHRFGIHDRGGCHCKDHARIMDQRGPEWCRDHIEIVIGWMVVAAKKRGWPAPRRLVRLLILSAIRKAMTKRDAELMR